MTSFRSSLLMIGITLCSISVIAQSGTVSGVVLDKTENSTLPGANVYIKGNETTGTITDIDGLFVLSGVEVGEQTLVVSFLGFVRQQIPVQITESEVINLKVEMIADFVLGKEVVVTAQALGQAKAINQQLNAESISNIVAADRIQELPDVNAAEAIARLPGVSINRSGGEGQKIVIRGMEPKFNAITVNGVRMPANDPNDRSVDLSLISPEILEGIELFKAPLPYMDAEAVGGTVNLKLRRAPSEFKATAKLLGGYNQINDDWGDYKAVIQASKRFFNDKLGIVAQGSTERFNRGGDQLSYSWSPGATDATTGITDIFGAGLSLQDGAEIRRRHNGSVNLDYDLGKENIITLFGLYSQTERDGFTLTESYNPGGPNIGYSATARENKLTLGTYALGGEHPIGKLKIDWNLSQSQSESTTPFNFAMNFSTAFNPFDPNLDQSSHPRNFFEAGTQNVRDLTKFERSIEYKYTGKICNCCVKLAI